MGIDDIDARPSQLIDMAHIYNGTVFNAQPLHFLVPAKMLATQNSGETHRVFAGT